MFITAIHHKDGIIPAENWCILVRIFSLLVGVDVPYNVYTHIAGVDLIRFNNGTILCFGKDNLRTHGVSYMLENKIAIEFSLTH